MKRVLWIVVACVLTAGCAGMQKSCAQFSNSTSGSDWIVVQYAGDGRAFHCWKLRWAVVESTQGGNVDWQDRQSGHLVHLTGWENRVQVGGGDFAGAAKLLGVDAGQCDSGTYPSGGGSRVHAVAGKSGAMLNIHLQCFAEQMVRGEFPSMQDEDVMAGLYGLLARDPEERQAARLTLRDTLNKVAPVASTPVLVEKRRRG